MAVDRLVIVLDAPGASYRPGDVVSGQVVVGLSTEKKVRGIYVRLRGKAEVSWTETVIVNNRYAYGGTEVRTTTVSGSETCADSRVALLDRELLLPPGEHVYRFRAPLPLGIPPAFEGDHGHVRYRVEAVLDRPWRLDRKVSRGFDVVAHVDLNLRPALGKPARATRRKTLWCASGTLTLVVHTPCTGYVPGQSVGVTVDVDNASGSRVDRILCAIVQKVKYKAWCRVKKTKDKMRTTELSCVEPGDSATLTCSLKLPTLLPPSGLEGCSIIRISYFLSVKAELSGPHFSPTVEIPLVVGTVPFTAASTYQSVYGSIGGHSSCLPASSNTQYERFE